MRLQLVEVMLLYQMGNKPEHTGRVFFKISAITLQFLSRKQDKTSIGLIMTHAESFTHNPARGSKIIISENILKRESSVRCDLVFYL